MYQYEFVRIELKSGFMRKKPKRDYQEIITEYAKNGWRFKQIFAPATAGYGASDYYELIFEKEINNET